MREEISAALERRLAAAPLAHVAGYRPAPAVRSVTDFAFTAAIIMEPQGTGTKYTAIALHRDPEDRGKHEAMGFHDGWGKALDQLVAVMRSDARDSG